MKSKAKKTKTRKRKRECFEQNVMGKNVPQHTFMRNRKLANRFLFSLQASFRDGQGLHWLQIGREGE